MKSFELTIYYAPRVFHKTIVKADTQRQAYEIFREQRKKRFKELPIYTIIKRYEN